MRLKSVYIEEYKNIRNQTFDFSNNCGYIALIGLNGSGKSSLLEAIGEIFNGIINKKKISFKYQIQYEHNGKTYLRKPRISMIDGIKVKDSEMVYPSSVIACYSGEDLRLWHIAFEDYYMHYFKRAIDRKVVTPRLIYVNKYCWSIALISLIYSDKKEVKDFLKNNFEISDLEKVEVTFEFADTNNFKEHQAIKWINRIKDECLDQNGKATMKSLMSYDLPLLPSQSKASTIFHYLYLLSQPKKNSEKGNAIDKYIKKVRVVNKGISSSSFSEGHKKMILIECIAKVLGDNNSLLLLDEPDAHVHIALKKEILNCIDVFKGQTLFTTHSPIFVNLMKEKNVFPIVDGELLPQQKRDLIQKIANNEINIIDSACIVSSKHVVVTEGPDDIYHIKNAIKALSLKDEKYRALKNISFLFMGGAKEVDSYYNEILSLMYDTIDRLVFVFDYDEEGREGAKMVKKLIDGGNEKFQYVYYHKNYPVPKPDLDFYLEDLFEKTAYKDVQLPTINGTPSFAEFKKSATWANSIKKRIQRHKREKTLTSDDYLGFQAFIDQLIFCFDF